MEHVDIQDAAYSDALGAIAQGECRATVRNYLTAQYTTLSLAEIDDELASALRDALAQGVEREDIDESWFS